MAQIKFIQHSGRFEIVDLQVGEKLLKEAMANGVEGFRGQCGGSCSCATCHCYVDEARLGGLPGPAELELNMLKVVCAERRKGSRLACQMVVSARMDGLTLILPLSQI